jgi:hypothetical protein
MPSDLPMICQERARLLRSYREATNDYAGKVCEMTELAMRGGDGELNAKRLLCRAAWDAAESSRLALARHEADHACDRAGSFRDVEDSGAR